MTRSETTNQSDEILATRSDFVPMALDRSRPENFTPLVDWQTSMKRAIRCSLQLRRELGLCVNSDDADQTINAEKSFPTFVPREYLARIRPGDPGDPLLRQVLPIGGEDAEAVGFSADPVGDLGSIAAQGLLHKYDGRALMITSGACGIHCRYCFRREFPYSAKGSRNESWKPSLDYLRNHDEINEVLLSGGDPLTLTDSKLADLITQIESIEHVRRLRIHTRMPIVIPQRVTARLLDRLSSSRLAVWLVVHTNHPNELDDLVLERIGDLVDAGIPVLNQAVLLRGINDDPRILKELCLKLVDHRVQPYYLHQLDRVRGASHFEVPIMEGKRIMEQLRTMLPGYAVPTYVTETPGAKSKTPLS